MATNVLVTALNGKSLITFNDKVCFNDVKNLINEIRQRDSKPIHIFEGCQKSGKNWRWTRRGTYLYIKKKQLVNPRENKSVQEMINHLNEAQPNESYIRHGMEYLNFAEMTSTISQNDGHFIFFWCYSTNDEGVKTLISSDIQTQLSISNFNQISTPTPMEID